MTHSIIRIVELIAVAGTFCSLAYYLLCIWSAAAFLRRRQHGNASQQALPPVSILKPLKGTDPEMYESFRSHCRQDYPQYEIIFGVSEADDPAAEVVTKLQAEFPDRTIKLVLCEKSLGTNRKLSNLVQMLPHAKYDLLIVNDSDIRVEPAYLRDVLAPLADPQVGLVTCLYRGIARESLGARLESLGISTDFCAGVLAAQQLEGISFGLGSTLAFRRNDLKAIGGFESFLDYLADDYQLGNRIAALGRKVELANVVVETHLPQYSLRGFFQHQLRWARTLRESRFWGYVGLGITFGLVWATVALIASGFAAWACWLLMATLLMRGAVALLVGHAVLGDGQVARWLALIPLRDFLMAFVWLFSFAGHTISWRGDSFRLKNGKLIRTDSTT